MSKVRNAPRALKKIDVHTHILPRELPDWKAKFGVPGFMTVKPGAHTGCARMVFDDGRFFRDIEANCWDPLERLKDCRRAKVDLQVLSTVPVLFSYWAKPEHGHDIARFLNDHLAGVVARDPAHFAGLGTLPLQSPELSVKELTRCMRDLGLRGAQIGSHINDWNLDEPALDPVWETAERLGAAIFVHPWDMMGQAKMPKYFLPWLVGMPAETTLAICSMLFGGVFERFPKLRVCFAHGGGAFPFTLGRIEQGFLTRPDLCAVRTKKNPRKFVGKFYVDSLVHDEAALKYLLSVLGENRVALGSDYPFPLGEHVPGREIERARGLSAKTKARLLAGTAKEWLGL